MNKLGYHITSTMFRGHSIRARNRIQISRGPRNGKSHSRKDLPEPEPVRSQPPQPTGRRPATTDHDRLALFGPRMQNGSCDGKQLDRWPPTTYRAREVRATPRSIDTGAGLLNQHLATATVESLWRPDKTEWRLGWVTDKFLRCFISQREGAVCTFCCLQITLENI